MISKIQRPWRQFRDVTVICSFQTNPKSTICGAWDSFRRPVISTLRIFAATNGLGGGARTDFVPWRGKL